jgi:hypothetical protein
VCSVVPKHTRDSWSGDTVQPGSCICYPWWTWQSWWDPETGAQYRLVFNHVLKNIS